MQRGSRGERLVNRERRLSLFASSCAGYASRRYGLRHAGRRQAVPRPRACASASIFNAVWTDEGDSIAALDAEVELLEDHEIAYALLPCLISSTARHLVAAREIEMNLLAFQRHLDRDDLSSSILMRL